MRRTVIGALVAFGLLLSGLAVPQPTTRAQTTLGGPLLAATDAAAGAVLAATDAAAGAVLLYDPSTPDAAPRVVRVGEGRHDVWGFAPDGCALAVTLQPPGAPAQLWRVGVDGQDARPLLDASTLPPDVWDAWEPAWSPDGARIAFTLSRPDAARPITGRERRVAWVPAEGGAPVFVSVTGDEYNPAWSPDGARLAYVSDEARPAGADMYATAVPTRTGASAGPPSLLREADLWLAAPDGTQKARLTTFATGSVLMPRWSPDGALLAFVYAPSANNHLLFMIAAQPGGVPTQLSFAWSLVQDVAWQPDGTALLVAARDFAGVAEGTLWRVPLVGRAEQTATPALTALNLRVASADWPRPSPDGAWLALRSDYALALAPADGATGVVLGAPGNTAPVWSRRACR